MDDLSRLHPVFRFRVQQVLADLQALGWQPVVASAIRSSAEQTEKVKKGYSKTMHSWHVPSTMAMLRADKSSFNVVNGNAADIVDKRYGWDGPASKKDFQFWKDLGRTAKKHGCEWGGDWKMRDVAHIQMLFVDSAPRATGYA